ncbi:MAG: lipid-A-disaccharide synthase [Candidatus Neomarinimicrobiota bacterium]|nr:MAG: lipid-A-disaccharide synthase [Candidatus Neomarinimicrobiota bacterium]
MADPTFFLVAGESSGDLHGAALMHAIRQECPGAKFYGHGGDRMVVEGLHLLTHINQLAVMGFSEVLRRLTFFRNLLAETVTWLREHTVDRVILIDYPGFNLRLARHVADLSLPVTYFILPQVWAWKENRLRILRQFTDQRIAIFPFEPDWFAARETPVEYVGHPFAEHLQETPSSRRPRQLALLPGSRRQEIDRHWPLFCETVRVIRQSHPDLEAVAVQAPGLTLPAEPGIEIQTSSALDVLRRSRAALVSSGTVSLEAAVADCPAVVCYRLSTLSWLLARFLVRVQYASIVNLIAGSAILPEFLQYDMVPRLMARQLISFLEDTPERRAVLDGYERVRQALGEPGIYQRAARLILEGPVG